MLSIKQKEKQMENDMNMIENNFMHDERLSFKAKGIFWYLQREKVLNKNALYSAAKLREISRDGKDAVKSAIDELVVYGYLTIHTVDPLGRYILSPYTLHDQSQLPEIPVMPNDLFL